MTFSGYTPSIGQDPNRGSRAYEERRMNTAKEAKAMPFSGDPDVPFATLEQRREAAIYALVGALRSWRRHREGVVAVMPPEIVSYLDRLDRIDEETREQREASAVDDLLSRAGHVEGCDYTLKATTSEMAVHAALFLQEGGPLPSCGNVEWWPHGGIPPDLPAEVPAS